MGDARITDRQDHDDPSERGVSSCPMCGKTVANSVKPIHIATEHGTNPAEDDSLTAEEILTSPPGTTIWFPVTRQAEDRQLTVDDREADREGTLPLRGVRDGRYFLEPVEEGLRVRFYDRSKDVWKDRGVADADAITVEPAEQRPRRR